MTGGTDIPVCSCTDRNVCATRQITFGGPLGPCDLFRWRQRMLNRLWKPWFIYRPTQMVQRAACEWNRPIEGYHPLPVAWGLEVIADPSKTIGHSIWTT